MSTDLFLKYSATDTGARPVPAGTVFWTSPAVTLATADGNYTVGTTPTINVQVSLMNPAAFEVINVQVWVCDPTTVAGPSTALAPFQGATASQLTLTGFYAPPSGQTISTVPTIAVTGFAPYAGISNLPGGHCCLIANCYGLSQSGASDGADLTSEAAINLPNEVQTDPHVAQRNIFADAVPMGGKKIITFPFRAASPLRRGAEQVLLEIAHLNERTPVPDGDLKTLQHGRFRGLPLHSSRLPVKSFEIGGDDYKPGRHIPVSLHAGKPVTLTTHIELDKAEAVGAVHAFDVIQRSAERKVQGGFRLLTVVTP